MSGRRDPLHCPRPPAGPGQPVALRAIVFSMMAAIDPMLYVRRHVDLLRVSSAICRHVG